MEIDILDAALKHASAAEVYSESVIATAVTFEANRCHAVENRVTSGTGLRVIWNDRVGFSSTTSPDRVDELVEAAVGTAKFGEPVAFRFPTPRMLPLVHSANSRISLLPPERMKPLGDEILELCRQQIPDLTVDLGLRKTFLSVRLVNSSGLDENYERATYFLDFTGLLILDSGLIWIYDFYNLSKDGHLDARAVVKDIAELAGPARRVATLKTGTYPCIFAHAAPLSLLHTIVAGVNGKSLEKGISPLIGREGDQVLDDKITIWDDGVRPFGFRSAPLDGEGSPREKTALFERGIFRNFLFDLKTAAATGRESTGNAGRDFASRPVPAETNLVVDPGHLNLAKAIAGMKEGLVVYGTVGGGQSNVLAGDVSLGISLGFKVENGEVVGRVKDTMVAGNVYELLRDVTALGDAPHDFGDASVPFFYLPAVSVATKT